MRNLEALSTALASWPATVPDAKKTPDTSTEGGREIKKDRMKRRSRSARERLARGTGQRHDVHRGNIGGVVWRSLGWA